MRRMLVALALLGALVGSAQAQMGYHISIDDVTVTPAAPLRPEVAIANVDVRYTVACNGRVETATAGQVFLAWDAPEYMQIQGPTTKDIQLPNCALGATTKDVTSFGATFTRDAPGLTQISAKVEGQVDWTGFVAGSSAVSQTEFTMVADYTSLYDVVVDEVIQRTTAGEEVAFDLHVSNMGNAATQYVFSLEKAPANATALVPAPLYLESPTTGQEPTGGVATFLVQPAPSCAATEEDYRLRVDTYAAEDPERRGNSAYVLLKVMNAGGACMEPVTESKDSPLPVAVPVLATLLVAFALSRRHASQ